MNDTSNASSTYPSVEISKSLMDYFPSEAQESLKTGMESCYNLTSRKSHNILTATLKKNILKKFYLNWNIIQRHQ